MQSLPFLEMIYNGSLLLTLALIYHVAPVRLPKVPSWLQQALVGFILGATGIVLMYTPWVYTPGIIFDMRSVLLGISGLFFGTVPTLIVMAMTVATRIYQGGAAALTGVLVILFTGTISIGWRHLRRRPLVEMSGRELYLFGIVIHIVMLLLMFTLPWETALNVLSSIALPVLILYPLATTLLGMLMVNRLQRDQSNAMLSEKETRYRLLADNVSDVLWVLNVETEQWDYISPSIERLTGYTVEEILAQPTEQMMSAEAYEMISMQRLELNQLTATDPRLSEIYLNEIEQPCKDGSTIWTEVASHYTKNRQGQLILVGVSRDIAKRKQAEDALRANEENFRRVVEEAPVAIYIQTESRFAYVNKATLALFGAQTESQLLGRPVIEHFHPDFAEQVTTRIRQLNEKKEGVALAEEMILKFDGTTADVEVSAVPFLFHNKAGTLVFMKDISEKKQSTARTFELALERERTAVLSTFVQEASHEFRTPLSIMQANLYLLKRATDPIQYIQKITQIEQQVTGISRLVDMLTESTRLENGTPALVQPMDLNTIIGEIVTNFQRQLTANALILHRDLTSDPLPITGAPNRLYAVLRELMDNAIRFTPAGGSICLRSTRSADYAIVEVEDNGSGIPVEVLPHIFKRFYRQDRAHTTPGLGLGLPIAKSIVEGHGGRIEVESQPGAGSLFRVLLPLTQDPVSRSRTL